MKYTVQAWFCVTWVFTLQGRENPVIQFSCYGCFAEVRQGSMTNLLFLMSKSKKNLVVSSFTIGILKSKTFSNFAYCISSLHGSMVLCFNSCPSELF